MRMRHKLLQRQIKKHLKSLESFPSAHREELEAFFAAVSNSYEDFDKSHRLLERSMEISSQELLATNQDLRLGNDEIQSLYRILNLMQEKQTLVDICTSILPEIQRFSGYPIVVVELYEEGQSEPRVIAQVGIPEDLQDENMKTVCQNLPVVSSISVPLDSQSGIIGLLTLADPFTHLASERFSNWLNVVAVQIGTVMEKKRLDDIVQLQRAKMIAAAKMSELGKMAGGIAHEINTPLATISLSTERLLTALREPSVDLEAIVQCAEVIDMTTYRIAKIISGLRNFSRDGSTDGMELVKLREIVNETLCLCNENFKKHGIRLEVEVPEKLEIFGRPIQISQVLLNLLNNSQDAIEGQEAPWVRIGVREAPHEILLFVMDSGAGISSEVQEKIFHPFFTTKGIGKGTGLGLSISAAIIKNHGGTIEYDGSSGNTCFTISFPRAKRDPKKSEEPAEKVQFPRAEGL